MLGSPGPKSKEKGGYFDRVQASVLGLRLCLACSNHRRLESMQVELGSRYVKRFQVPFGLI